MDAFYTLCTSAYYLALSMRRRRAEFEWGQARPPDFFANTSTEIDRIEPFAERLRGQAAKVFFSPLYKIVDGNRVLLRKGTVLFH